MTDHLLTIVTFLPLVGAVALIVWRGALDSFPRPFWSATTVSISTQSPNNCGSGRRTN